jgi:hypothetical protein
LPQTCKKNWWRALLKLHNDGGFGACIKSTIVFHVAIGLIVTKLLVTILLKWHFWWQGSIKGFTF